MNHMLFERLPQTSVALLNYFLSALGPDQPWPMGGNTGLPAGALECLENNVVVVATPVTERMFDDALCRFAGTHHRDTVLIRHGFRPETLDPVRVDVALRSTTGPILVPDLSFYRDIEGGLHLVPEDRDLFLTVGPDGVGVSLVMPWNSWDERRHGLEQAAAGIVRACQRVQIE